MRTCVIVSHLPSMVAEPPLTVAPSRPCSILQSNTIVPCGLENVGSTCYMNAILQCLFQTSNLVEVARQKAQNPICQLFSQVVNAVKAKNGSGIVDNHDQRLTNVATSVMGNLTRNQDAAEFLHRILENMNFTNLFTTKFFRQSTCNICGHMEILNQPSVRFTPPSCPIPINISPALNKDVQGYFELFLRRMEVSDGAHRCSKCGSEERKGHIQGGYQLMTNGEAPFVVLQLDRFSNGGAYHNKPIPFDNTLNLQGITYDLYGIVLHRGSMAGGHYTALVRREEGWKLCNDTKIEDGQAAFDAYSRDGIWEKATPYLLFYRERGGQQGAGVACKP